MGLAHALVVHLGTGMGYWHSERQGMCGFGAEQGKPQEAVIPTVRQGNESVVR